MNTDQFSRSSNPASGSTRSPLDASSTPSQGTRPGSQGSSGGAQDMRAQDLRAKAGEAVSNLTDAAQQAGSQVKQAASSLASDTGRQARGLLNQQVAAGADLVGHVADLAKSAADSLDQSAPQLAAMVRSAADRIEDFSRDIRGQSVEELIKAASDFTRRQPAVVFGLASVAGFFLFRILKSSPPSGSQTSSYKAQPSPYRGDRHAAGGGERLESGTSQYPGASQYHGV